MQRRDLDTFTGGRRRVPRMEAETSQENTHPKKECEAQIVTHHQVILGSNLGPVLISHERGERDGSSGGAQEEARDYLDCAPQHAVD